MRARQWVPELGTFLSIDELAFHDPRSTLWGWPRQNPIRYRDPSGRLPMDGASVDNAIGARAPDQGAFQQGMLIGGPLGLAFDGLVILALEGGAYAGGAIGESAAARWLAQSLGTGGLGTAANKASSCSSSTPSPELDPEIEVAEARAQDLLKAMNQMDNIGTSRALTDFFKANAAGGDIKFTPGVTRDALMVYREVAEEAIEAGRDTQGVQAIRRDLIDRALGQ